MSTLAALVAGAPGASGLILSQSQAVELGSSSHAPSHRQTLHNFQNVQYYADFLIGGQEIAGIFDTGSFELLVRSSRCAHCVHPTPPYDRVKSGTYDKNGTVTKHVFGSGPCISVMGYENVTVGAGMNSPHQSFWEITDHRIQVLDTAKFAAIVGIGPNFAYGNEEKTLLMSFGVEEFSICLQKPTGSDGFLNWGPEPNALAKKDMVTAKVTGKHHWAAQLSNVAFGHPSASGVQIPCGAQACTAIVDSGTSLIAAPGIALMQLSEMIPPVAEDCSNLHELPNLNFVIDGQHFELPPEAYVMRVTGAVMEADSVWDLLFFKPKIRKVNQCMPAFMQMDMVSKTGPVWILGMPFFRYYHTTFDRKNKEMHFAQAGPNCEQLPLTNRTGDSFLDVDHRVKGIPMDIEVDAIIPPTLSEMMDYPFSTAGEIEV